MDHPDSLAERAASGDASVVDDLVAHHLPALRAYVRLHLPAELRARESCSDVVQSVCREVLQKGPDFEYRGPEAFRGWLYSWARHKIFDRLRYWRAEKREGAREADIPDYDSLGQLAAVYRTAESPSQGAIRNEEIELLEAGFDRLPDEYREVIALSRIADLSREEVGQQMGGRSRGAVRSLLNRALVKLSAELEALGVEREQ